MKKYTSRYIEDSYNEMLLRFAIAAEYKDDEIGRHIIRVSDYSTAIAKALNLSAHRIKIIRFASIMHDIGKIGVPNHILHRKNITPRDYDRIKKHAIIGEKIFAGSNSELLKAAGEIALCHHEWYDGTGYPGKLKGKRIPLYARIVALADMLDAIISKRSYKGPQTLDAAVEIIVSRKTTQFDPGIVEAFLDAMPQVKEILNSNKTIEDFLKENIRLLRTNGLR